MLLGNFRFVPSNHTWVPVLKGLCRGLSVIQDSCALRCASWAAFLASSIRVSLCWNEGMSVFLVGWCMRGVYPMSRSNGVFFVVAEGQEFLTY